jgi:hypothetical protein
MAVQPIVLVAPQQLTNAAATYYTSANILTRIDKLSFTNQDTGAHTVSIYLVPPSGTAGVTNQITKAFSIPAGSTWNCPDAVGQTLPVGGTLQMLADTGAVVTVSGSGTQISPS